MIQIKTIPVGPLETNCYIASNDESCIVIDPGYETEKIIEAIGNQKVEKIILTHLHFDHITVVKELKEKLSELSSSSTDVLISKSGIHNNKNIYPQILCHKGDIGILGDNILQESDIAEFLDDNQEIPCLNDFMFKCLHVPGHTPGSICLYSPEQNILFSGDTIFKGNIGATHFKGGNFKDLKDSIEKKLLTLPDDVTVYPGHGGEFRLGDYKKEIRKILE